MRVHYHPDADERPKASDAWSAESIESSISITKGMGMRMCPALSKASHHSIWQWQSASSRQVQAREKQSAVWLQERAQRAPGGAWFALKASVSSDSVVAALPAGAAQEEAQAG